MSSGGVFFYLEQTRAGLGTQQERDTPMREHTVNESSPSTRVWAGWEELFRQQVQSVLQALLEEEVTEFLGRVKSQRRDPAGAAGPAPAASRNGHGQPRQLSAGMGT